ncbi:hypothetical protein [Lentzea flava]|uniref:Polyketide cyclase / dehydrase and lipid transport n=1 Tax=Lentzea flava TaxID=103732 RepID=A0ABQ2VGX2_9PSEU|nr:hypothetical protein [Lentzea flava]GGU82940.1 hypothetical protein GCM10010178_86740 [Lentzea flava]
METIEPNGEIHIVNTRALIDAPPAKVWKFLTQPGGDGFRKLITWSRGLEEGHSDIAKPGYKFTEYVADPDDGSPVACTWETFVKSAKEWRVVAEDVTKFGLSIDLTYSISAEVDGTYLRRRMQVWTPPGKRLTEGWRMRLCDHQFALEHTRKIVARIVEGLREPLEAQYPR